MVTNYAKPRVKLRIKKAKFQFVVFVFCNRAVLLFNFLIKKTMDSDESYHSQSEFYYPDEEDKENNLACWIINLLLDVLLCSIAEYFYSLLVTRKNTQRYYTTKRLIRYIYIC